MAYAFNDDKSKNEVYDKSEVYNKSEIDDINEVQDLSNQVVLSENVKFGASGYIWLLKVNKIVSLTFTLLGAKDVASAPLLFTIPQSCIPGKTQGGFHASTPMMNERDSSTGRSSILGLNIRADGSCYANGGITENTPLIGTYTYICKS